MKISRSSTTTNLEEYELLGDAKYRQYVQQIDKALKGFEYTSEWADLVNALGKLNKVLQNNQKYNVIPRRFTVGQRLAQCMHPALPSGVHLKALETYDLIFKCIGTERLIQELSIYSNGLFPLLSTAAINVKPALLEIYESHVVPLGQRLRPALDGFIIAVLPGLEEGTDHHDRTDKLLSRVCDGVGHEYFYGSLWRCILNNPSVRLMATNYIISHFNKKKSLEDQLHIMGTDIPTLIIGKCASLLDSNVLAQRAVLDLLLCCFPMHNCQIVRSDMVNITTAALTVLLRRDVSLNRRLCLWLFGPESGSKTKSRKVNSDGTNRRSSYFETYSKELVFEAFKICLSNPSKVIPIPNSWSILGDLWQYRLLICLMDHQNICSLIIDDLNIEILRALYHEMREIGKTKINKTDLLRQLNLLFTNIGINYLWQRLSVILSQSCLDYKPHELYDGFNVQRVGTKGTTIMEICSIVDFIIEYVPFENYPEISSHHLPLFLQHIIKCLINHCELFNSNDFDAAIMLCIKIVNRILPSIAQSMIERRKSVRSLGDDKELKNERITSNIREECENDDTFEVTPVIALSNTIQSFFSLFVRTRMVESDISLTKCFSSLCVTSGDSECDVFDLQPSINVNKEMSDVYLHLCQLIVEISTIETLSERVCDKSLVSSELPLWLQYLLVMGVYPNDAIQICYSSISSVLNLITVTKALLHDLPIPRLSYTPLGSSILELNTSNESTPVSNQLTQLVPMISSCELSYIYHQTAWFYMVTSKLWNNLDSVRSHLHLETALLLQHLHNLAEDSSVCESIICTSMLSPSDVIANDARNKFIILYNITRDNRTKSIPQSMIREFDRPLFIMLDSLKHKVDIHNAQAIDWLNQSIKNNDIARVLEPLLFILLHPDTCRISVQHVHIQPGIADTPIKTDEADNVSIANSEAKIYAISSTGGNVIYHVNNDGKKRISPSPVPYNKVLTLTSQSNSQSTSKTNTITTKFNLPEYLVPESHERNMDKYLSINMFLNPFGSMSSLNSDALESLDSSSLTFTRSEPNLSNIRHFYSKSAKPSDAGKSPTPTSTPILSRATTSCSTPIQNKKLLEDAELSDSEIISSLLEELIDKVVDDLEESESEDSQTSSSTKHTAITNSETISVSSGRPVSIGQMYSHMLLYQQVYDSRKTLYALSTLWNMILTDPQLMLLNMATTSISNRIGMRSQELQSICARHKNSLFGKGFYSESSVDSITSFRSSSFLEIIVSSCIDFMRSYYPSLPQSRLNEDEILGNQRVRILSCEILRLIFSHLVVAIKGGQTFATYLYDMLMRCKIQKSVLQCLVSSVYNFQLTKENNCEFAETLIEFNEKKCSDSKHGFQEDYQKSLLTLLEKLMMLEHKVAPENLTSDKELPTHNRKGSDSRASRIRFQPQISSLKYYPNMLIPAQSMFLSAIQTALQQTHKVHLHANWLSLVESTLPFAGRSLSRIVVCVLNQLCLNLETCADLILTNDTKDGNNKKEEIMSPNYLIVLLKNLATLSHFCLLDSNSLTSTPLSPQPQPQSSSSSNNLLPSATNTFQMFTNIFHVFSASDSNHDISAIGRETANDPIVSIRKTVLSHLPRVLTALLNVWKAVSYAEKNHKNTIGWEILGNTKDVKQNILSFLSPISLLHGSHFMSSVAMVWYDFRNNKHNHRKLLIPICSNEQNSLVELVAAIRVLPMESVLLTLGKALKQPNPHAKQLKRSPIEVCMLQFFLAYIKVFPGTQLIESWKSVLALLKDGLQITSAAQPLVQFHLLAILHEFAQAAPLIEDRKDQKDLQDVAQKLVVACTTVAGARLGQTKWLRRNLEVIPGPQSDTMEDDDANDDAKYADHSPFIANSNVFDYNNISESDNTFLSKFSVQALCALAEFVAPVLDVVYVSEEKEKVVPLVSNIMYYITPYLKNHSRHNAPSFRACSHLLSNISGYQYTRKAWRKDAFELLLDPSFFQMDSECFAHWKTIVDHLMTHDKTSFRDFLSRMSVTQRGSLQIFSSKDQEIEQRANLVKRLAFILFCSERDQYQKYMSEIQEKLIESLRLSSLPIIQAQVLLCFRVIILRMSAHHLTSLWPFIYTEMFQVFLHIEMELMTDTPEFSSHIQRLSTLDSSWVTSQSNGLAAHNNPTWLNLYLAACKLLDLAIAMPADSLPQFQMYRWAFVGGNSTLNTSSLSNGVNKSALHPNSFVPPQTPFEPHVVRINNLMSAKNKFVELLPSKTKCPLLTITTIKNLLELHPFFHTVLKSSHETIQQRTVLDDKYEDYVPLTTMEESLSFTDSIVEADMLEPIPSD